MGEEKWSRRRILAPPLENQPSCFNQTTSYYRSPCGLWLTAGKMPIRRVPLVLYSVLLVLLCPANGKTMCPSVCSCHDDTLQTTCIDANLEVVPIQFNPYVEYIDLHDNRIHSVDYTIQNYHKLKHLDLSINKIHSLKPHNFELQERLITLNISHNLISSLSKGTFKGLKSLQILDISNNQIETLHSGAFKDTNELQVLDLSYNRITYFSDESIFNNLKYLRVVSLQGNQIVDVPSSTFKHLPTPSLEVLKLSENLIEELDEHSFPSVTFSKLRVLTLGSNVIRDIHRSTFNSLHFLSVLDLSDNNLTFIPTEQLSKLSQLTELDLSSNMFDEIRPVAFQSLFHLKILNLSFISHLTKLDSRAFVDNIRLETIIMDYNTNVKTLPTRIFYGNHHLLHVSLKKNSLSTVDSSHFPLDRLKSLDLSGNPLNCNCSLLWLWELVQDEFKRSFTTANPLNETFVLPEESQRLRINLRNLKCDKPDTMNNSPLRDVPESTVRCETRWMTVLIVSAFLLALFGAMCVLLLFINTDASVLNCKKSKDPLETAGGESRRLASNIHSNSGPPPILMLMPDKDYPVNPLVQSYMKGHGQTHIGDLRYMEPWVPVKTIDIDQGQKDYSLHVSSTRKSPHIVYV